MKTPEDALTAAVEEKKRKSSSSKMGYPNQS